jgi:hypothetical protein
MPVDSLFSKDTSSVTDTSIVKITNLYKYINSFSFSAKMEDKLKFMIQAECISRESAEYLKKILKGMITISKLSSSPDSKVKSPVINILEKTDVSVYDNTAYMETEVTSENIKQMKTNGIPRNP